MLTHDEVEHILRKHPFPADTGTATTCHRVSVSTVWLVQPAYRPDKQVLEYVRSLASPGLAERLAPAILICSGFDASTLRCAKGRALRILGDRTDCCVWEMPFLETASLEEFTSAREEFGGELEALASQARTRFPDFDIGVDLYGEASPSNVRKDPKTGRWTFSDPISAQPHLKPLSNEMAWAMNEMYPDGWD